MKIEVKNIQKSFGRKVVLRDISFEAEGGECIGIIGANGCGKSTLFSILAGVQRGKGEFLADGVDLIRNPAKRNKILGYIPQDTPLIEELSAYDNLLLWYSKSQIQAQLGANGIIKWFGVSEFMKVPVRKMSGGMKKRLSIACSVAHNPDIIIMDEPTAALDIVCKETINKYIGACKKAGKTVILSTHEAEELSLCDKIYLMKDGILEPFEYNNNVEELVAKLR